jgi:ubiquinone/menaquinone biosynthesis C-methylase UbiE
MPRFLPIHIPLLAGLAGCDAGVAEPVSLSAEQQRLRAAGAALYDRVGWTYQHRDAAALANQLIQRHADPARVLDDMPIEPGMTIADVGCGVGWFTFRLADAVGPDGRVLALDIQQEAVDIVQARSRDPVLCPHGNVEARQVPMDDVQLEPGSVDLIFLAHLGFYLHRELLDENILWMQSLARALQPDGSLVILEFIPPGFSAKHLQPHFEGQGFSTRSATYYERYQTWLYVFDPPQAQVER